MPPPKVALLSLTVLLVSVNLPEFKMPPPTLVVFPPLRIVTPLMFTVTAELTVKTPLLGRTPLLPSMMVVEAPPPVMVRWSVIVSSVTWISR